MIIPKLKRVKMSSELELRNWLAKNAAVPQEVMLMTCNKTSRHKHISSDQVREALGQHGWTICKSYTFNGNLVGHVVSHA